ncbi:MAG: hypothetical protein AAFN77_09215 [Planctomycetota bacterium]
MTAKSGYPTAQCERTVAWLSNQLMIHRTVAWALLPENVMFELDEEIAIGTDRPLVTVMIAHDSQEWLSYGSMTHRTVAWLSNHLMIHRTVAWALLPENAMFELDEEIAIGTDRPLVNVMIAHDSQE